MRMLAALLTLALTAPLPAAAGPQRVIPVDYRVEYGPASGIPATPPNFDWHRRERLRRGLADAAMRRGVPLDAAALQRMDSALGNLDRYHVDNLSPAQWDAIVSELADHAGTRADLSAGWDAAATDLIRKAAARFSDPYTAYMDRKEHARFREGMAGQFAGIGATLEPDPSGGVRVQRVFPGSPAQTAGLSAGDVIVAVDGLAVGSIEEATGRIRGTPGTPVTLRVRRAGQADQDYKAVRAKVTVPNIRGRIIPGTDIAHVCFNEFNEDTDEEFIRLLRELRKQGARRVVIDVRGNPGGSLDTVANIVSEFLRDGDRVVETRRKGQLKERYVTDGDGEFAGMPVQVLVDGGSASASEILSGALQDHVQGPAVVGSRTFGKGSGQNVVPDDPRRPDAAGAVRVTSFRWYTPDGRSVEPRANPDGSPVPGTGGVAPDVDVPVKPEDARKVLSGLRDWVFGDPYPDHEDAVLERAVELFDRPAA